MRILYISQCPPFPLHDGGAQRSNVIYRALCSMGDVDLVVNPTWPINNREELQRDYGLVADFVCQRPCDLPPFRWFLKWKPVLVHRVATALLPRSFDYRPDTNMAASVRKLIADRQYDVIVGRYLRPTMKAGVVGTGPALVLDLDDLETQGLLSRLKVPGRPKWERFVIGHQYRQLKRLIPLQLRKFDLVWITNEDKLTAGEEINALSNKVYLPNIPVQVADRPMAQRTPLAPPAGDLPAKLLFVGNFYVDHNKLGVDHFVQEIWPKVHAAEPAAIFRIVGSGLSDELRSKWNAAPGVEAIGLVQDLTESYAQCRFTIAPIFSGAGTNIKVLESLCFNRTSVLTEFAQRGYEEKLRDENEVLIANSDDTFAAACVKLLREPALCEELAARGRKVVAEHYSFESFCQKVTQSIEALLAERRMNNTHGLRADPSEACVETDLDEVGQT